MTTLTYCNECGEMQEYDNDVVLFCTHCETILQQPLLDDDYVYEEEEACYG